MGKIDPRQIDLTEWNDHRLETCDGGAPQIRIYNPYNETTYLTVRKSNNPVGYIFVFNSEVGPNDSSRICDGRVHKICVVNLAGSPVEIDLDMSPEEHNDGSVINEVISTFLLGPNRAMTIYYYWVRVGDRRYCFVTHSVP